MKEYIRNRHHKYYKESRFRHIHIWGDILFVILILSLAITLFYLRHYQPFSGVSVEIKNPTEVVSGKRLEWEIYYHANKALTNNTLTIRWPDNFSMIETNFTGEHNKSTNTFYLDNLERGSNGKIIISAIAFGSLNEDQTILTNFNCAECGLGFLNSASYKIKSSELIAELMLPTEVYAGSEFSAKLKIKNNSEHSMKNISFLLADSWKIVDGDISIDNLNSGEERELTWHLSNNLKAGVSNFSLDIKSQGLTQVNINKDLDLKESSLKLSMLSEQKSVYRQEVVDYVLSYDNLSQETLNNISFNISGIDSIKATSLPTGWRIQANNLYIDKISPQGSGRLLFSVSHRVKRVITNQSLALDIKADYEIHGELIKSHFLSEPIKITSDLNVKPAVYYYSPQGDQLGVGPLPPVVGMATSYWIMVDLNNYGNNLNNFSLSFDLPKQVFLTGNRSVLVGDFHYAAITDSVIWKIPKIEANQAKYKLALEIALAPEESDLGKVLILADNWHYSATDDFTGQEISGTLDSLDTNLSKDPLVINKGIVVAN